MAATQVDKSGREEGYWWVERPLRVHGIYMLIEFEVHQANIAHSSDFSVLLSSMLRVIPKLIPEKRF